MAGINRSPPPSDPVDPATTYRASVRTAAQARRVAEDEMERELNRLDDAIAGTDRHELARLRARVESEGTR